MNTPYEVETNIRGNYAICKIPFKDEFKLFVLDKDDIDKLDISELNIEKSKLWNGWHFTSNHYISKNLWINKVQKQLYLHNLIMNKLTFEGKGQTESIDHINRCGRDNRKENLKLISQSLQNKNQKKRKRKGRLADRCEKFNINSDSVPTCIEYVYEQKTNTEKFSLNLKHNGKRLTRKVLSKKCCVCKKFPEKLQQAIQNFELFKKENPKYFIFNQEEYELQIKKFNEIIRNSGFDKEIIETNLIQFVF